MRVKSKTSMQCFGVDRKPGEIFEMNKSDAEAHVVAGLVEILGPTEAEISEAKALEEAEAKAKADAEKKK